jgi:DNA-binding LacI/PurR family transcriptional regulator
MTAIRKPQPTIRYVAAAAGVSKSTVSNVVTGAVHVSPKIEQGVLEAIARVG